ncbi:MAG: prepilin peptidase [Lachnospiraceae bacterium]|nr:prepilin peptidase [Lachnospiraceae bacterium]
MMQAYFLMTWSYLAALTDVMTGKIPNVLTASGCMAVCLFSLLEGEGSGLAECLLGICVVTAVLLPFFLLRMIGAGDIKLIMMIGGALGPDHAAEFLFLTMVFGGVISIGMFASGTVSIKERADYFISYCGKFLQTGQRTPYRRKRGAENYPFSVPVLLALIFWMKCR